MTRSRQMRSPLEAGRHSPALTPIAAACSVLILISGQAYAQAAATTETQTVTVKGIRKGIEDAINVKKNSDSIVEAISAEDIGKLPDASVAESISRLPGVTAQRSAVTGKSQQVSVRGMSPDFNGGLLNGREQASTAGSRGVEFDQYPSELLGGVVIYKTPDASLAGLGLSSTIDLQTVRPLAFGQRNLVVNYRKEHSTKAVDEPGFTTGDGDRFALSYIDQFADRTVGVALGLTQSKSRGGARANFNSWGGWAADVDYNGGKVKTPGGFTTDIETTDSERTGFMGVFQYKPNKEFESILDLFYSKGDFSVKKRGLEGPLGGLSAGANDKGGKLINATVSNGIATAGTFENWKGVIRNHNEDYTDTLHSIGWANTFKTGGWTLKSDLSYSKVVKDSVRFETTAGLAGDTYNAADTISYSGFNGTNFTDVKYTSGLNYADPNLIKLTDVQGWAGGSAAQAGYYANPKTTDDITALRLSGKHDLSWGPLTALDVGVNLQKRTKERVTNEGALLVQGTVDANGNYVNRLASAPVPGATVGVGGLTGIPTLNFNPVGTLGSVYQLSPWTDSDIVGKSWGVEEKVNTLMLKGDLDSTIAGLPVRGNVGLQLISTKQTGLGYLVDKNTCDTAKHTCGYTAVSGGASYNDFLPSLNLTADLGGDKVLRLGLGRVLARANMEDMKAGLDFGLKNDAPALDGSGGTVALLNGSAGNPELKPFRANAFDLSFEKYFGKKGYVSIAGFHKELSSYILKVAKPFDYAPYVTPNTVIPPAGTVGWLTQPINGSGGTISGVELAVNVPFSLLTPALNGFGVQVNYSNTSSSLNLASAGFSTQNVSSPTIPLPGLSKEVTNLRLYYENHGWQIAVAGRNRSSYLGSISDFQDQQKYTFIKGETVVDLQANYEFESGPLKGLSILAQANNLTNEEFAQFDVTSGATTERKVFGKSYLFGVNYKF